MKVLNILTILHGIYGINSTCQRQISLLRAIPFLFKCITVEPIYYYYNKRHCTLLGPTPSRPTASFVRNY